VIYLGIDTMVMDNDDAEQREGVEPAYKKVKGFQPLQIFWKRMLVDAIFRNGRAHRNHGNHAARTIAELVRYIRRTYAADASIVVVAGAGFFDQKLFALCDRLNVGYIIGGKLYEDITEYIEKAPEEQFAEYYA